MLNNEFIDLYEELTKLNEDSEDKVLNEEVPADKVPDAEADEDEDDYYDEYDVEREKIIDELGLSTEEEVIEWYKQHRQGGIELTYPEYTDTWEEDRWEPGAADEHRRITKSQHYEEFDYRIDIEEALYFVWEYIVGYDEKEKLLTPAYLNGIVRRLQRRYASWQRDRIPEIAANAKKFLADYQRVKEFYNKYDDEELLERFIATNIDDFVYYYEDEFRDHYYDLI